MSSSNITNVNDNENSDINDKTLKQINNTVQEISMGIRGNNMGWIKGGGLCEVCGLRPAEVNLDLQYGSHRECRICWND